MHFPFYEDISAGFPSPATDENKQDMRLEEYLIDKPNMTIFVKVTGDSMKEAGICDGDALIVEKGAPHQVGDIVIAVIDKEYTVKYLEKNTGGYYLRAGNEQYEDMYAQEHLEIFGVVIGCFRKYR